MTCALRIMQKEVQEKKRFQTVRSSGRMDDGDLMVI